MDNASSIKLIKRRVSRGNKHVIKLNLVRLGVGATTCRLYSRRHVAANKTEANNLNDVNHVVMDALRVE